MNRKFEEFEYIINEMKHVYLHDQRPWMIGYSGGKDSTLLVQLVFEMVSRLEPEKIEKKIYIVTSDTMVENPIVKKYMHTASKQIGEVGKKYKIESHIIYPEVEKTFWSCVIGLGYPTPEAPNFRWCTDRLKIQPSNKFTTDIIDENGEVVILLGVRKAESVYRANGIKNREIEGKILIPHNYIQHAYVYNPLTEIPNEVVWEYLLKENSMSPWHSDNKYLFSLYQGEDLGEEQSVVGQVDHNKIKVTGNSRFGCWICTMVKEDKSLNNFINHGSNELIPLRNFRNWLLKIRNDPVYRDHRRRNGSIYRKRGTGEKGLGAFKMSARVEILERLLTLQKETGEELITIEELKYIDYIWDNEGDLNHRTLVDTYYKVYGEKLYWDAYKNPSFSEDVIEEIKKTCEEEDYSFELLSKLIIAVDNNKLYSKGKKVEKAFNKVINQGWLHFDRIEKTKKEINNETEKN